MSRYDSRFRTICGGIVSLMAQFTNCKYEYFKKLILLHLLFQVLVLFSCYREYDRCIETMYLKREKQSINVTEMFPFINIAR